MQLEWRKGQMHTEWEDNIKIDLQELAWGYGMD
jgi:hypothetical protein